MRTKALLLTAILGVTGVVSTLAQSNVYSVNVVGYVTVTVTNESVYRILANPLISTNNSLSQLVPVAPDGSQVSLLTASGYQTATYDSLIPGWDNELNLPIGTGFFIKLGPGGQANPVTITFVGEVAQDAASNQQLPATLSLKGAMVPQSGSIITVHALPGVDGSQFSRIEPAGGYETTTFDSLIPGWDNDLSLGVAEGFFYAPGPGQGVTAWDRNFKVQ